MNPDAQSSALLYSFESSAEIDGLKPNNVKVEPIHVGATQGRAALRIDFAHVDWPNLTFPAEKPWDWSRHGGLALDVANPGNEAVTFAVRIDDDPAADGVHHSRSGQARLAAGEKGSFVVPLGSDDPMAHGMRGGPTPPGVRSMGGGGKIVPSHIVAFQVFLPQPPGERTLIIDNVRLVPPVSYDSIVDEFGQYRRMDWPGKVHVKADLDERRKAEERSLRAAAAGNLDPYGGWAAGPKLPAAGFFRTARHEGKWSLVTPDGHLFFSLGADVVDVNNESTVVTGREAMFTWLPKPDDPLAKYYGTVGRIHSGPVRSGRTYNFYAANLERKYGADAVPKWREVTLARLHAWGFNTIGNWSDYSFYGNGRVPYVATLGIGGDHARLSSGDDYWGTMHDPFDPQFEKDVDAAVKDLATRLKDDPWLVGYFVDNELSWGAEGHYGLAYSALGAKADQPAKRALLDQLKRKYETVEKLNAAWRTDYAAWDAMDRPKEAPAGASAAMKADLSAFEHELARQYFRVVASALKRYDPNHLYLGCRFAWRTPEAVAAAAESCDVVSFNIYEPRLDEKKWAFARDLGKPCIIGEFHFGALDRGMLHTGLVPTRDQADRAAHYRDYVGSVADHPAFVGCHWFQYIDEPLTGRSFDGENYNIGFVTVTDTPYPEMVAAAKEVHSQLYRHRWGTGDSQAQ